MDLRTRVYRSVVLRGTDFVFGRSSFRAYREVARLRSLPRDGLRAHQLLRLQSVLAEAVRAVPYYADRFAAQGLNPATLRDPGELAQYPMLTRPDIRSAGERLRSTGALGRVKMFQTSGSTGSPVVVIENQSTNAWRRAIKWHYLRWWDVAIGERGAVVWLQPLKGRKSRFVSRLAYSFNNCNTVLDVSDLSNHAMAEFWDRLVARRITHLYGYTAALTTLARFVLIRGLNNGRRPPLKVVVTTAETLFEEQRRAIEAAFACRVANEYGCAEVGPIAFECPAGSMHVAAETYYVEVAPPFYTTAEGVAGQIVVTDLRDRPMPLIRYALGDIVHMVEDECACGTSLPIMRSVLGRVAEVITTPDGRAAHSAVFSYLTRTFSTLDDPAIVAFRTIQHSSTDFELLIVPGPAYRDTVPSAIRSTFKRLFGEGCDLTISRVEHIPADPSGKIRSFQSSLLQHER